MKEHNRRFAKAGTLWGFIKYIFWAAYSLEAAEEREQFHRANPHIRRISPW